MPTVWSPRLTRLKAHGTPGDTSVHVYAGPLDGTAPFTAKLGTELVQVTGQSGDTMTLGAPLVSLHPAGGYLVEVTTRVLVGPGEWTGVVQNLKHREASPKGELEATWDIYTRNPALYDFSLDANPLIFYLLSNESGTFKPFFGGVLGRSADSQSPNGFHHLAMTGRGAYVTGTWRGYDTSNIWPADTPGYRVLLDAFGAFTPWVSPSREHVIDGGLQIGQQLEGIGKTPVELADLIGQRGDLLGSLDWYVRTDPDFGFKLWVVLRERNPVIDIPLSTFKAPVTFVKDYEYRRTMVQVKWRDGVVDAVPAGPSGAVRWRWFDYSTRIDNEDFARQVAGALLANMNTLEAISDGQVTIEWPKPVYKSGVPFPHHLIRAGWRVNVTAWTGGFVLGTMQIKELTADHKAHTVSLSLGKVVEDDLNIAEQFMGKETKLLGSAVSGILPQAIAPPEGTAQPVASLAASVGSGSGRLGWKQVEKDADIVSPVYTIDAGHADDGTPNVIAVGRKTDFPISINGRVRGFRLRGNDGDLTTPGPGTISIKVGHAHFGDAPGGEALVTTIGITADTNGTKDLAEPPGTTDVMLDVVDSDYLSFEVEAGVVAMNNVAIAILIQRTSGSDVTPSTGGPSILGLTVSKDPTTGYMLFTVTTDRPCTIQVEYGQKTSYGSKSQPSETLARTSVLTTPSIGQPFHWRAIATDSDGHVNTSADQTG